MRSSCRSISGVKEKATPFGIGFCSEKSKHSHKTVLHFKCLHLSLSLSLSRFAPMQSRFSNRRYVRSCPAAAHADLHHQADAARLPGNENRRCQRVRIDRNRIFVLRVGSGFPLLHLWQSAHRGGTCARRVAVGKHSPCPISLHSPRSHICITKPAHFCIAAAISAYVCFHLPYLSGTELIRDGGGLFLPLVRRVRGGKNLRPDRLSAVPEGDDYFRSQVFHRFARSVCFGKCSLVAGTEQAGKTGSLALPWRVVCVCLFFATILASLPFQVLGAVVTYFMVLVQLK